MNSENKGLIFIPDISGYTRFINEMEIEHSRLILEELLETLINANQLGLEISEIEGDAILFYKYGSMPLLKEIYGQVEKMFREFHKRILAYDHRRFCQCKACMAAVDLSLKIITHYGEFTGFTVKNFNKLMGKDVIVAHQLLKNDIPQHEYWLVTENLLQGSAPAGFTGWMEWNSSIKQTENGEIAFKYTQLGPLKNNIEPDPLPQTELDDKVKIISVTEEYDTDIITLFHATGDFNYRSQWLEGVKKIAEIEHFLPRVGMKCRYELDDGQSFIYTTSYYYSPERIEFSETDENKESAVYYTLESLGIKRTKLTIDCYSGRNPDTQSAYDRLKQMRTEDTLYKSLQNLRELVKVIKIPASSG